MSSHPRSQRHTPRPKPLRCLSVELVPGEFIDNEATTRAEQAAHLIEDQSQAVNVMQREACDGGIETSGFMKVFNPTAMEDPTVRGFRIDCHDVIAGTLQPTCKPSISAPDFEDASRRCGQL